MSAKRRRFIPCFDRLEDRWVPAGNITAHLTADGVLRIVGDDEANFIKITESSGTIKIESGTDDTTINSSSSSAEFTGVKSINAKMMGGDDNVIINGVYLTNAVEIEMGDGNDTLTIDQLHTGTNSAIYGQAGDDNISITHGDFRKSLQVWMGAGDDTFNMVGNYFGKDSGVHGGQGNDTRTYSNNAFGHNSWIDGFETFTKVDPNAPHATDDSATVDQGADVTIDVAANDNAVTGSLDLTSIAITQQPANGTVTVNDDGTVTYTNNGAVNASDSFTYTIRSSSGAVSNPATVNITINAVNQPPVANNDTATDIFGGTVNIPVAANDTDAENQLDFTTITFTQQPQHGTISLNLDGTVKYINDGTSATTDTFKYTIKDLDGNVSNEATVTITVSANVPPVAVADTATVAEGSSVTINLAANDTDANNNIDLTSIVITQQPAHGAIVVNNNGTVTYTQDGSNTTSDSFTYTIKDTSGAVSNTATASITITPVNDPPVANNDTATVNHAGNVIVNVAANDTDSDGTIALNSIVITQQPAHGSVVVNTDGTVTYTQDGSNSTSDTFLYTIKDNSGAVSNSASVTITINPINVPPVAGNDAATLAVDGSKIINVASNDTDSDGTIDLTSITITQQPANGTVVVNNDGTVTYTHDGSNTASDSFQYTIKDNGGATSNVATVSLTIQSGDSAPVANNDAATLDEGTSAIVDLAGNDTDSDGTIDPTTIAITQQPAHGTLVIHNDGTVTYTHDGSETTADSFKYTIRDNLGSLSNEAIVAITVNPVNDPPIANDDTATVDEAGSVIVNVAGNDTDVDGTIDLTSISITQQPQHGTLTVNSDGTVTYQHDGSETITDSFKYTIKDNDGAPSNEANVAITINPINDPPVAIDDSGSDHTGFSTILNLAANDTDVDGTIDLTTINITQNPQHGTVIVHNDGTVTYTHDGSATTSDSFKYTIKDNDGSVSNEANVTLTISDNQPPVANDDAASLENGASAVMNLASNDTDADGSLDLTSIVITQAPTHGTVVVHTDGTVTYTHDGSASTSDTFKYTIKDNDGALSNEATAAITITTNQSPVANDDTASVHTGFSTNLNVAGNDTDADGTLDLNSIVITQQPAHGTVVVNSNGTLTYTQDGTETASDSFKYTIKDNEGAVSNEGNVTITIADNQAPVAQNDSGSVAQGAGALINLAANDSDPDGTLDLTSIVITQQPAHGTLVINNDGTVTYTHDGSATLADVFAYLIKDSEHASSNNAIVTLTITPV